MLETVETLCKLAGVREAGIYKNTQLIVTNFSQQHLTAMTSSSDVINQVFFALESVNKTHNELYFAVNSGYLAAFRLHGGHVALLLTDKKLNFPMLSMAIKSASETLKQQANDEQLALDRLKLSEASKLESEQTVPTEESLTPVFDRYTQLLNSYLGPAAPIVVNDAVNTWKQTYLQAPANIPYLIALLAKELDSPKEQQAFSAKAAGVVIPAM